MTAADETHERGPVRPGGDPTGTLEVRAPGTLAAEPEPETAVRTAGGGHGGAVPAEEPRADGRR
ncbi:hypothetical protein, partial [Streptomyces sp. JW3]|uniref:hypothetical protein n=1 Tax=Streptomyces sp. JW3 TaxID=3456955 RepID=UPI003FA4804D